MKKNKFRVTFPYEFFTQIFDKLNYKRLSRPVRTELYFEIALIILQPLLLTFD